MSSDIVEDHWFWDGKGTPDGKQDRRREFHKSIALKYGEDGTTRRYKVGDTVNMAGGDDTWVAQIIDLFQVNAHDPELRQILRTDSLKNESKHHYELKRCTLRWFYNFSDMDPHSLRTAKWPKILEDEIWFSDHIEKPGYNSVQVIDGRAWLFDNMREKNEFLTNPPEDYDEERDIIRIVRGFVDSTRDHLPVRLLVDGELEWLQANPSQEKDLFHLSKSRFEQRSDSPSKRKRPKHKRTTIREPVNVDEDEFDPADTKLKNQKKRKHPDLHPKELQEVTPPRRAIRRRKVVIDEDEESSVQDQENDPSDNIPLSQLKSSKPRTPSTNIALLNDEVRDLVASLNASAFGDDVDDMPVPSARRSAQPTAIASQPYVPIDEDEITPAPPKPNHEQNSSVQKGKAKPAIAPGLQKQKPKPSISRDNANNEIIIIDSDDEEPPQKPQLQPRSPKLKRIHPAAANRAYRGGRHGKPSARNRPSFMPTTRERSGASSGKQSDTNLDKSRHGAVGSAADTASQAKRFLKPNDSVDAKKGAPTRTYEEKNVDIRDRDSHNFSAAERNSSFDDGDEIRPVRDSKVSTDGRGTKRTAGDDIDRHPNTIKRRALGSPGRKAIIPDSSSGKTQAPAGHSADALMEDVEMSPTGLASGNVVRGRPEARNSTAENVIDVNDSDTDPDDRALQEEGHSILNVTQSQRELAENVNRICERMNAKDKNFLSNQLEWLIDEIILFHDGQKGSLNAEEYERVLRDQLVQKRQREIGSLSEIPVFESDTTRKRKTSK
eukprot:TRINITY_DN731_c0_g1_i2.p2 TRINITY_DN731_c0_g1~~TRINITY_DN731_c0_g1_i2.p2  ORF type:complete len:777 (-),score=133.33 TRINITY_DN731_c0_g1_i2:19980-22310(-)